MYESALAAIAMHFIWVCFSWSLNFFRCMRTQGGGQLRVESGHSPEITTNAYVWTRLIFHRLSEIFFPENFTNELRPKRLVRKCIFFPRMFNLANYYCPDRITESAYYFRTKIRIRSMETITRNFVHTLVSTTSVCVSRIVKRRRSLWRPSHGRSRDDNF